MTTPILPPTSDNHDRLSPSEWIDRYLERNFRVLPLHPVNTNGVCKCPAEERCDSPGKHPVGYLVPRGSKSASSWRPTVERWLARYPDANWAITTGPSGIIVVDVDPRNGGDDSLAALTREYGDLPDTLTQYSGRGDGGRHLIFRDRYRHAVPCKPRPGIDIIARAGYIVAAPSLHAAGGRYRWADWDTPIATPPDWLLTLRDEP